MTPPEISAPEAKSIDEIFSALDENRIVTFHASQIMPEDLVGRDLSFWKDRHGDVPINRHSYRPDYRQDILEWLDGFPPDAEIDTRGLPRPKRRRLSLLPGLPFCRDPVPLRELIELLESKYADMDEVDASFARARVSGDELRESIERQLAFGVFNSKEADIDWRFDPKFARWRNVYNWLWVGLSFGELHCDEFDNMLLQLTGKKVVLMYEYDLSQLISSGTHYIQGFPSRSPLSPEACEVNRRMAFLPYYRIVLEPGFGVTIPRGVYHAPLALSYDSVSLASFVRRFLREEAREPMALVRNVTLELTDLAYRLAGLKLMRFGPYEMF